jgi:magnesium transporter
MRSSSWTHDTSEALSYFLNRTVVPQRLSIDDGPCMEADMAATTTFYLSRILGNRIICDKEGTVGKLQDIIVDTNFERPKVIALKVKAGDESRIIDFSQVEIKKAGNDFLIECSQVRDFQDLPEQALFLAKTIMDKQIVDMDGRKVVRVNDLRIALITAGAFLVAVDVGIEGLFRRLGIDAPVKYFLKLFGKTIPSDLILWDDVETISPSAMGIKLSMAQSKLLTLHPSDLADIIEDLDRKTQAAVFASLDEEKAADVLEELETEAQKNILESLPVEKAADVLEKMPADEAADILDELEVEKAEELLSEMEQESSEEVRELMEYPDNAVGSIMTTDYFSFAPSMTVDDSLRELRRLKPETDTIYYLYVTDEQERIIATVSLRDIVVSEPAVKLDEIMNKEVILVHDFDKIDTLADIISKYSLLALPVVDKDMKMQGMVIIDDVVDILLKARRRRL